MKYRIIDKRYKGHDDLKLYTLEALKTYFTIDDETYSNVEQMSKVQDIDDLMNLLKKEENGMDVPYEFEKVEEEKI